MPRQRHQALGLRIGSLEDYIICGFKDSHRDSHANKDAMNDEDEEKDLQVPDEKDTSNDQESMNLPIKGKNTELYLISLLIYLYKTVFQKK